MVEHVFHLLVQLDTHEGRTGAFHIHMDGLGLQWFCQYFGGCVLLRRVSEDLLEVVGDGGQLVLGEGVAVDVLLAVHQYIEWSEAKKSKPCPPAELKKICLP